GAEVVERLLPQPDRPQVLEVVPLITKRVEQIEDAKHAHRDEPRPLRRRTDVEAERRVLCHAGAKVRLDHPQLVEIGVQAERLDDTHPSNDTLHIYAMMPNASRRSGPNL